MATPSVNPFAVIELLEGIETAAGNFIADNTATGIKGYVRDQYRKRCDQFANAPTWAQLLTGPARGSLNRICEPYWDDEGTDGPISQVPFTGGQCEVLYDCVVTYSFTLSNCQVIGPVSDNITGRLGPLSTSFTLDSDSATAAGGLCPGFSKNRWELKAADGNNYLLGVPRGVSISSFVATRADAQPDDCGDPPPELVPGPMPPPNPGPTPGPEPTDDPNAPFGPPLLPIPPYDDPVGGPTPIVGPDPFEPVAGPDDIPGNTDSSPGGPENVSDPIEVDPGPGGGGDETDFGVPPAGRAWVGCLLQFTFPPAAGAIAGSAPANAVSPRIFGNGSLVFDGGRGTPERVNGEWHTLVRPSGALKVTGVYVNCEPGFTYTVSPMSVELCPENSCTGE